MEIETVNIVDIQPYENNPRKNDQAVSIVAKSIKEFGFVVPIILDDKNVIIAGHTRIKAAIKLGMDSVPVIYVSNLNEHQIKAFRIMDNKSAEIAEWDIDLLKQEFYDLEDTDYFNATGFSTQEISEIWDKKIEEDNFEIPKEPKYQIKPGEIWQLGKHRLMCGDATKKTDVNKLIQEDINIIFTSPPYNMANKMYENYKDNLESQQFIDFNLNTIKAVLDKLKGFIFWNISYNKNSRWEFLEIALRIQKELELRFMENIIWHKKTAIPINSKQMLSRVYENIFVYTNLKDAEFNDDGINSNFIEELPRSVQLDNHLACFPIKIPTVGIQLATKPKETVYDPFGGSGTTLIACEQLNRVCYMMEIDPFYCSVIIERWENLSNQKALVTEVTI